MRVARILTRLNVGGPALTALAVSERLAALGHETILFCGDPHPAEGNLADRVPPGVRVSRVPGLGRDPHPLRDLAALATLRSRLARFRPDIVHTHAAKAGAVGRMAAMGLARRPRLVHTFHGHVLSNYFSPRVSRGYAALERWLARRTDRLIAVSPRVRDELVGEFGVGRRARWSVVPGALLPDCAPPRERSSARRSLGLPEHGPVVGVIARLTPIKGHTVFLEALSRIHDLPPAVAFVGDGPSRTELARVARELAVEPLITWTGWVSRPRRVLQAFDLVVLPSLAEGLPLCLLEAMAAGLPVVASAVGGVCDLVTTEHDGLLVPAGDPVALSGAISRLLEDRSLARRLGAQARLTAGRYTLERLVAALLEIYEDLLRGGASRRADGVPGEDKR